MEPDQAQNSSPAIPIAIIVGFALIAVAIFFTNKDKPAAPVVSNEGAEQAEIIATGQPRPVDATDYIRGNPNAPILLIEYSDYDCPFCKQFHETMNRVMDEIGVEGRVAWVYRQFPIEQLHPNSPRISEAALCVGDIAGNAAFWQFTDLLFEQREFDVPTNVVRLSDYAELIGVNKDDYNTCMDSGRMKQDVIDSVADGFNAGIRGTPHTYVVAGDQQAIINGARSYETIRGIVENLIDQLDGNFDIEAAEAELEGQSQVPAGTQ